MPQHYPASRLHNQPDQRRFRAPFSFTPGTSGPEIIYRRFYKRQLPLKLDLIHSPKYQIISDQDVYRFKNHSIIEVFSSDQVTDCIYVIRIFYQARPGKYFDDIT